MAKIGQTKNREPPMMRPKKYAICGSHGTGKTTLALLLASSLTDCQLTEEVPRRVLSKLQDQTGLQRGKNTLGLQLALIAAQISAEARVGPTCAHHICDRSVLDHLAYTERLFPNFKDDNGYVVWQDELREWSATYSGILYLPVEFAMATDGVREEDVAFQRAIDEDFLDIARRFDVRILKLSGTPENRLKEALHVVRQ
jgi:predicted ATPase